MKKFERLPKELKQKTCKICGVTYFKPRDWGNKEWLESKYCSGDCFRKDTEVEAKRRKNISKTQRGRKLSKEWKEAISEGKKGIKLTPEHINNMSKALKGKKAWNKGLKGMQVAWNKGKSNYWAIGEKNVNWKGGISPINKVIRESLEYKEWRTAVFKRDNYTCQNCDSRGGSLNADHIMPFSLYPELRFVVSNGRTLCKDCHDLIGWSLFRENNPRKSENYKHIIGQNI